MWMGGEGEAVNGSLLVERGEHEGKGGGRNGFPLSGTGSLSSLLGSTPTSPPPFLLGLGLVWFRMQPSTDVYNTPVSIYGEVKSDNQGPGSASTT